MKKTYHSPTVELIRINSYCPILIVSSLDDTETETQMAPELDFESIERNFCQ